jgi:hypothetical protein
MIHQRLIALFFFPLLFLGLSETCPTEEDGPSIDETLQFNGTANTKTTSTLTTDDPSEGYTAEVEITSNDAIDASDVRAFIIIDCQFSEDHFQEISLRDAGTTRLTGKSMATGSGCVGVGGPVGGGQNERVTFYVHVDRINRFVQLTVRVNGSLK